jgi:septum site-determining protein MinD
MAKIIAVTGGKGGSGKSTCSIMLSLAFAKLGKQVLLVDMDAGMRCLDMLLRVSEDLFLDLSDAVKGRDLESCLLHPKKYPLVSLLCAPSEQGLFSAEDFSIFVSKLNKSHFDIIIFDLPAGSDRELYGALPPATEFLCIANPNPVSVRDGANIGLLLDDIGRKGYLVLNRFEPYFIKNPVFDSINDIIDETGLTLCGIIPESDKLGLAFLNGKFPQKGHAFRAFLRVAKRLLGQGVSLPKLKKI